MKPFWELNHSEHLQRKSVPLRQSLHTPFQSRIKSESFALELRSPSMVSFESSSESYEVWSPLGSVCGGQGTVWLARHKPANVQVALKIYELDKCEDEFELIQVSGVTLLALP